MTDRETPASIRSVVHVVPTLFGTARGIVGGAERYALELARFMSRRVSTTLVSFGERSEQWTEENLTIRVLGRSHRVAGQRSNPFSWELTDALRGADVVHVHQQHVLASSVSAILARLRGQRVFATDLGGGGWDVSGYVSTDRWYHGHLHISAYSRRTFGQDLNVRAHVILGGVDTEKFSPDSSSARTGNVFFVCRLLAHKGIDVLIDAIDDGLSVEIIGHPYDDEYLKLLEKRSVRKNVIFRHNVTDDELVAAYRRSACIVLPSVYRDMFGNTTAVPELLGQTLLEGMSCGIPAVCSDVASMPEIVTHGVTGFVVAPNDPASLRYRLHSLVYDTKQSVVMGRAARADVLDRFTWPAVVERCLAIYAGQVGGGTS